MLGSPPAIEIFKFVVPIITNAAIEVYPQNLANDVRIKISKHLI